MVLSHLELGGGEEEQQVQEEGTEVSGSGDENQEQPVRVKKITLNKRKRSKCSEEGQDSEIGGQKKKKQKHEISENVLPKTKTVELVKKVTQEKQNTMQKVAKEGKAKKTSSPKNKIGGLLRRNFVAVKGSSKVRTGTEASPHKNKKLTLNPSKIITDAAKRKKDFLGSPNEKKKQNVPSPQKSFGAKVAPKRNKEDKSPQRGRKDELKGTKRRLNNDIKGSPRRKKEDTGIRKEKEEAKSPMKRYSDSSKGSPQRKTEDIKNPRKHKNESQILEKRSKDVVNRPAKKRSEVVNASPKKDLSTDSKPSQKLKNKKTEEASNFGARKVMPGVPTRKQKCLEDDEIVELVCLDDGEKQNENTIHASRAQQRGRRVASMPACASSEDSNPGATPSVVSGPCPVSASAPASRPSSPDSVEDLLGDSEEEKDQGRRKREQPLS